MASLLAGTLAQLTGNVLERLARSVDDLTVDELHALPLPHSTSIGFNAWHVFRSADNIVHFAFYRELPIWRAEALDEAWSLPRNDQGTGMSLEEVQAFRFPNAAALAKYGRDVASAICSKIEEMDDDFLLGTTPTRVMGETRERPRVDSLGTVVVSHGNEHYGYVHLLRQLVGKEEWGV